MEEKTVEQRLDELEKSIEEKDNTIKDLQAKNTELTNKLANFRIDGLVKKVEPTPQPVKEEIVFDFDV